MIPILGILLWISRNETCLVINCFLSVSVHLPVFITTQSFETIKMAKLCDTINAIQIIYLQWFTVCPNTFYSGTSSFHFYGPFLKTRFCRGFQYNSLERWNNRIQSRKMQIIVTVRSVVQNPSLIMILQTETKKVIYYNVVLTFKDWELFDLRKFGN